MLYDPPGRPRAIKPPPGSRPVVGHPLAKNLVFGCLCNDLHGADIMGRLRLSRIDGIVNLVPGCFGQLAISGTASHTLNGVLRQQPVKPQFTIAAWAVPYQSPAAGFQAIMSLGTVASATNEIGLGFAAGPAAAFVIGTSTATLFDPQSVDLRKPVHIAVACNGANANLYTNGKLASTAAVALTAPISQWALYLGTTTAGIGASELTGLVEAAFCWDVMLNGESIRQLYVDPFGFIQQPARIRYLIATQAAPFTVKFRRTLGPRVGQRMAY